MSDKIAKEKPVRENSWDRLQGIWKDLNDEIDTWRVSFAVRDNYGCSECEDRWETFEFTLEAVEHNFQSIEDDLNLLSKELHPQERKDLENHIYAALDATEETRAVLRRLACVLDEFKRIGGRHWSKPMNAAFRFERLE